MKVKTKEKLVPNLRFKEFEKDWNKCKIQDLFKVNDGTHQTPKYLSKGIPFVSVENIKNLHSTKKFISKDAFQKEYKIKPRKNDILMTRITAGVIGDTAIVKDNNPLAYYVSLALLRNITSNNVNYLQQRIETPLFKKELHKKIIHVAFPKKINLNDLNKCNFSYPSLPEQKKIASFLLSVDDKLNQLRKKKELLNEYKKGIMQKIFSQELRFKDDNGNKYPDWEEKKLGKMLNHKSIRNKGNQVTLVLSVSNKEGFISQKEQFGGYQVASKDISNYKLVYKGEYAYNPSRINVGSIARLEDYEEGIVSPMYIIFKLKPELNAIFFDALYSTHRFKYLIKIGCSGSVRDSLNFDELEKFNVKIPSYDEQEKISNFLSAIDSKIDLVSTQIDNTKAFKKGLLQQMFV